MVDTLIMEETYTDKAEYGKRTKDFTFKGMPKWVREMYRVSERNARRRNIPFLLSRQEFKDLVVASEGRCMMTGIVFEFERREGSCRRPFAPSLDRVDSSQGYTRDNCRLICVLVNLALNQWGSEPLLRVARNLVQRADEIQEVENQKAFDKPASFFTIGQFAALRSITLTRQQSVLLGSAASRLCRIAGVDAALIPLRRTDGSPAFTSLHAYPSSVLARAFSLVGL